MNLEKLKEAEMSFYNMYPKGSESEEILEIAKKHKMEKMIEFARTTLSKEELANELSAIENVVKLVSRSSMVSVFEKARFKDFVREAPNEIKIDLISAIDELVHGDEERGFNYLLSVLEQDKLAKWTLVSVFLAYYNPTYDVFMKPTTVKGILKAFDIDHIKYNARPSYDFYKEYRDIINTMKKQVNQDLSKTNAAFSGFLMMTVL